MGAEDHQKRGRSWSIHHVNDVRWTRGGRKGADIQIGNVLNLKVSFMMSNFDHVKVWSPELW